MSVKLDGYLKPFRGKGDNLSTFWSKFLVLCTSNSWDTDAKKSNNLMMFLDGPAFTIVEQLPDAEKNDPVKIKAALEAAFAPSAAEAYHLFVGRRLSLDEPVDSFLADLKRLLALSKHAVSADGKDPVLIEQFLSGLPVDMSKTLRLTHAADPQTISQLIAKARAIQGSSGAAQSAAAAASGRTVLCYSCGQVGHLSRNCRGKDKASAGAAGRGNAKGKGVKCFKCGEHGHIRRNCPQKSGTAAAATDSPSGQDRAGLCLAVSSRVNDLVRVAVEVQPLGDTSVNESGQAVWCRQACVVDTGCTRSLVERSLVEKLGMLSSMQESSESLMAIDGNALNVHGSVEVSMRRLDGPVYVPQVQVQLLVVDNLDALNTDILIGSDIVSQLGGVSIEYDGPSRRLASVVFGSRPVVAGAAAESSTKSPSRHLAVSETDDTVQLCMTDVTATFNKKLGFWEAEWKWKGGESPSSPIGSGIGEYSKKLTDEEQACYTREVESWIQEKLLVPYDEALYGKPLCVLPFIAVPQAHKPTTPVRPCLDYRKLNDCLVSHPGYDAPVCAEKLRQWRANSGESVILDLRKAYLQVRVAPNLVRYQAVVWNGQLFAMTRMGFGLNVAPKILGMVVSWVTRDLSGVDAYVDDLNVPKSQLSATKTQLARYGLEAKPAVDVADTRVLGLQLSSAGKGGITWTRRSDVDLSLPSLPTSRQVASWCGKLLGHYPVCGWLRPACSYIKRQCIGGSDWDGPVSELVVKFCKGVAERLSTDDPVHGGWSVPNAESTVCNVWCDASSIALGAVVEVGGSVLEDCSWLRPKKDTRHINVVELESVVKALNLATKWPFKHVVLHTDSKTVHGWLQKSVGNISRLRVGGLNEVLVRRRVQIVEDIINTCGLQLDVKWVASPDNLADALTRVPSPWLEDVKKCPSSDDAAAEVAAAVAPAVPCLSQEEVQTAQAADEMLCTVKRCLENGRDLPSDCELQSVKTQLCIVDGVVSRSIKLVPNEVKVVPVIPAGALQDQVVSAAHQVTGHAGWDVSWKMLRTHCFFPGMSDRCREFVRKCVACQRASPRAPQQSEPTRPVSPGGPWEVVQVDTLELGRNRSGRFHCVLVCIDTFTKWVEVQPLERHDAQSVATAFVAMCCRWGAPRLVRSDNGTEFRNALVTAVYKAFGVEVAYGAVRHPQSQGAAERFNQTLLTLIRKLLAESDDWQLDLELLLYYYRVRPQSVTKLSPMGAMSGWSPRGLVVDRPPSNYDIGSWVAQLDRKAAQVRDYLDAELAKCDFLQEPTAVYQEGDPVLLRRPHRRQKRAPPYESGWVVSKHVGPATVLIRNQESGEEKIVNIDLVKPNLSGPSGGTAGSPAPSPAPDNGEDDDDRYVIELAPPDPSPPAADVGGGHRLRARSNISRPRRYSS